MRTKRCVFILLAAVCSIILFGSGLDAKTLYGSKFTLKSLNVDNLNVENVSAENFFANSDTSETDYILTIYASDVQDNPTEIKSYSLDIRRSSIDSYNNNNEIDYGLVRIVKPIDQWSPRFAVRVARGFSLVEDVIIEATLPQLDAYIFQVALKDARVVSHSTTMTKEEGLVEILEFSYGGMVWSYNAFRPDGSPAGSAEYTFDIQGNYAQ